ncbi:MAG: hypothetical protein HQ591_12530 [candidate division Zixibacteria bacterium]|nr:hypothetical protein [Candidatus Tariuqbacter arcticus]
MEKYQQNTVFPLDTSSVEVKNARLVYFPLQTEYSAFDLNPATHSGTDPNEQPSILDRHIEKYHDAWKELADL